MKSKIEKEEYSKLSKRALYCMYTADIITGAVILAAVAVLDYFWIFPEKITLGKWISLGLAVLILADVLISPYFRYHRYCYSINDECIDIKEGYLFVKRNIVSNLTRITLNRLNRRILDRSPKCRYGRI